MGEYLNKLGYMEGGRVVCVYVSRSTGSEGWWGGEEYRYTYQCEAYLIIASIEHPQLGQLQLQPLEVRLRPHDNVVVHIRLRQEGIQVRTFQLLGHVVKPTREVHQRVVEVQHQQLRVPSGRVDELYLCPTNQSLHFEVNGILPAVAVRVAGGRPTRHR